MTLPTPIEEDFGRLNLILREALLALASRGAAEESCRLAARAWWYCMAATPARRRDSPHSSTCFAAMPVPSTIKEFKIMSNVAQLDVRALVPARRHQQIFATYEALSPGGKFVLVNDHDPKPLYYQFDAEHHGAFSWRYLEQGPEVWRVEIGRTAAAR